MHSLRFIVRTAWHYRRANLGVLAGTALAAAILSGALVVGDSVKHTLHTYAMQRLGKIEVALTANDKLLDAQLAADLRAKVSAPVSAVLLLPGMAIAQDASGQKTQVNKVQALGVDETFWQLGDGAGMTLGRREAALDLRLAARLGVKVGDTVALRIAKPGLLSRDAPLSSREDEPSSRANFTVKAIASDEQLGRFGLAANQLPPYNFFVGLADLQQLADADGQANLVLAGPGATAESVEGALESIWKPEYAGFSVAARGASTLQLESRRIFFDTAAEKAALAVPGAQGALTYLVNSLEANGKKTPYSFMTSGPGLSEGLGDDGIVINAWLAQQLGVGEGAKITVKYYEVLPSNAFVERAREFTVKRVLSMEAFQAERALVPKFPGLSDVESCADWKIGMPMDEELLKDPANEAYWKEFRETPKAIVTLAAGQAMWSNRFGQLTAVRFDAAAHTPEAVMAAFGKELNARDAGLEAHAVRALAAQALANSGQLGGLFLGLSFFLLIAAFVLTGLLYAFGAQQRAESLGVLSALGYTRRRVRALLLGEALLVAVPGAVLGVAWGLAYAWLLMIGLARFWQDAVGHIAILYDYSAMSLVVGVVGTVVCALLTAALTQRRLLRHSVNELLHADFTQAYAAGRGGKAWVIASVLLGVCTLGMVGYGIAVPPADPAEIFFTSGFLALSAGLCFARHLLRGTPAAGMPTTASLARLNATRRRGRSLSMVATLASGGFLVLATSAMQSNVAANADKRSSGTGGFALYGEATVPIIEPAEIDKAAAGVSTLGLRLFDGDDASCLNLNQAVRPRVLGMDIDALTKSKAFVEGGDEALWSLLDRDLGPGVVPALVGDSDTAMWTLRKKTGEDGDEIAYRDDNGREVKLKLVGKLPMRMSVFQGTVLVSSKAFTQMWPSREGFRVFLLDGAPEAARGAIPALTEKFERHGLDVVTTVNRIEQFHAVEGTYLSMFLVLGGIGLLLGSTATGVVVLRNLIERRREIALLRAIGFAPQQVFRLFAREYGLLLVLAVGIGGAASIVAMLPALAGDHGLGSVLARLAAFALVIVAAGLCALGALVLGLRDTSVSNLNAE